MDIAVADGGADSLGGSGVCSAGQDDRRLFAGRSIRLMVFL